MVMFPSVKFFMYECLHSGFICLDCTHIRAGSMTVNPKFSMCYLLDGGKWVYRIRSQVRTGDLVRICSFRVVFRAIGQLGN